jgi:hypothetical protein
MLHALYIPAVFVIGLVIGYLWGASAAKQAITKAQGDLKS